MTFPIALQYSTVQYFISVRVACDVLAERSQDFRETEAFHDTVHGWGIDATSNLCSLVDSNVRHDKHRGGGDLTVRERRYSGTQRFNQHYTSQTSFTGKRRIFCSCQARYSTCKHRRKPRGACSVKVKRDGSTTLLGHQMSAGTRLEVGPQPPSTRGTPTRTPPPLEGAPVWP